MWHRLTLQRRGLRHTLAVGLGLLAAVAARPSPAFSLAQPPATALTLEAAWTSTGEQLGAEYAYAVSGAGDVNGDGYADVLVGARRYDAGLYREGAAFVFYGSAGGLALSPAWTASGGDRAGLFGGAVAAAGDVNGDGYADVVIGAPNHNNLEAERSGAAYVYHGSPQGLSLTPAWVTYGTDTGEMYGAAVSGAGDLNGDGYADVVIGVPGYSTTAGRPGAALVFFGSAGGLGSAPWQAVGAADGDQFGAAVSGTGDLNGDGYGDLAIGAPGADDPAAEAGAVVVFYGAAQGPATAPGWAELGREAGSGLGAAVSGVGDVNGDGFDDLVVGAPGQDGEFANAGAVYVWHGSAAGLLTTPLTLLGGQAESQFGAAVSGGGDWNNDGYADLWIGAPRYDGDQNYEGAGFVYLGTAGGPAGWAQWRAEGNKAEADFGRAMGLAGDVTGDGYADLVAGAPLFRQDELIVGRAFVFAGRAVQAGALAQVFLPLVTH